VRLVATVGDPSRRMALPRCCGSALRCAAGDIWAVQGHDT